MNDAVTLERADAIAAHINKWYRRWPLQAADVLDAMAAQDVTFRRDLRGSVRKLWNRLVDGGSA